MMNKRILSFLLAVMLIVGLMPTSVFATENEGEPAPTPVIEPAEGGEDADGIAPLTEEGSEGEEGEGAEPCTVCNEPGCEKTHTQCEACGTWDCEKTHTQCEVCDAWDCTEHKPCDLCGAYDCGGEHEYCTECDKYNCGIDHNAACDKCGVPGCTKAHIWCDTCQKEDCGILHVWCDTCQKNDCGIDHTVTEPSEGTTVPEEEETEPAGPQVGDKIWIKSGAKVYKNINNDKSWTLLGNYEVEIEAIKTDEAGNPQWYRFKFTTLGVGEALLHSYNYVAVADTTEEQPEETTSADENACDCGEVAPENLAQHADSCPRKSYIKTLFEGKTAEEIYAEWENYDEATQTDILNMLEVWDKSKFEELNDLVDKEEEDFPEVEIDGALLSITVPEGAFPEGTKSSVEEQNGDDFASSIENVLTELNPDSNILKLIAMDISFECDGEEVQPEAPVTLTFEIAEDDIPSKAESAYVFHITDSGEAELMAEYPKISSDSDLSLEVTADSFSSYVIGFSNETYDATLLKNALSGDSRYSIEEFPVNLFNYDMDSFNNYIDGLTNSNFLKFVTAGDTSFQPNNGGAYATQGIVKNSLKNGYPEMTYGFDNGAYIFNTTSYTGKTVAANKNFEFIYDNQTGYYEYNSALNHAQLNGNKVQLYTDTLGPYNFTQQFGMDTVNYTNRVTTSTSNGVLTVKTTGTDPWFGFYSAGYSVSEYSKLYLRLYSDTTETLQVFFNFSGKNHTAYTEANSIKLTMKKGWNEYYFDYSGLSSGTLYAVRIDVGNTSGKTYKISKMALIKNTANIGNLANMSYAGFYPFESIESSYPNQYKTFDKSAWAANLQNKTQYTVATRSMYNAYISGYDVPTDKFHFGMTMEQNFYMPQSRQVNGKDIVFEFSGDDDMWVFIDGKLALDIGGGHTVVNGSINFTTGAVSVSKARKLTSASAATSASAYSGTLAEALRKPGDHTIKIFYLERFSTASNCRIKFNLPVVPTGNVVVEKKVNIENGPSTTEDMTFTFKAEVGGKPFAQKTYTVATKDASGNVTGQTNKTTDANGQFTLKHNEAAYFNGIAENTKVKITEITPQNVGSFAYKSTTVNGASGLSAEKTTTANGISSFSFVNTYEVRLADLKITKKGIDELDHHEEDGKNKEEKQSTVYTVSGTTADGKTVGPIKVAIVGNDSITIKDLPVGSYTVTEDTSWSWRYGVDSISAKNDTNVTVSGASITFDLTYLGEEVTYTNNRNKIYWLSGDSYCENQWNAAGNVTRKDS